MIGKLRGTLVEKQLPWLIIELNNGVGYEVEAPMSTFYKLPELGHEVALYTHQVVREDAHLLYGFYAFQERALFRALIKANGVGPKLALTILSSFEPEQFIFCVQQNDSASLVKVPGVGKKTAERLLIEMRDKLKDPTSLATSSSTSAPHLVCGTHAIVSPVSEAQTALVALGYKPQEASRMVTCLDKAHIQSLSCEQIIKLALREVIA